MKTDVKRRRRGIGLVVGFVLALVAPFSVLVVPDYEVDPARFDRAGRGGEPAGARESGWRRDLGNAFRRIPRLKDALFALNLVDETESTILKGRFVDRGTRAPIAGVKVEIDGWVADQDLASSDWEWERPEPVLSGPFGYFAIETVVRPGHGYAVIAQREGYNRVAARVDHLRPGMAEEFGVVTLEPTDWIGTVQVIDELGAARPEFEFVATILAESFGDDRPKSTQHIHNDKRFVTDERGFVVIDVPYPAFRLPNEYDRREYWHDKDGRDGFMCVQTLTQSIRLRLTLGEGLKSRYGWAWLSIGHSGQAGRSGYSIRAKLGDVKTIWRRPGSLSAGLEAHGEVHDVLPDEDGTRRPVSYVSKDVPVAWAEGDRAPVVDLVADMESEDRYFAGGVELISETRDAELFEVECRIPGLSESPILQALIRRRRVVAIQAMSREPAIGAVHGFREDSDSCPIRMSSPEHPTEVEFSLIVDGTRLPLGSRAVVDGDTLEFELPDLTDLPFWKGELRWPTLGEWFDSGEEGATIEVIRLDQSRSPAPTEEIQALPGAAFRPGALSFGRYLFRADRLSEVVTIDENTPEILGLADAERSVSLRLTWSSGRTVESESFMWFPDDGFGPWLAPRVSRRENGLFVFEGLPRIDCRLRFISPHLRWLEVPVSADAGLDGSIVDVIIPAWPQ